LFPRKIHLPTSGNRCSNGDRFYRRSVGQKFNRKIQTIPATGPGRLAQSDVSTPLACQSDTKSHALIALTAAQRATEIALGDACSPHAR
jgi:hypothetical protein